MPQTGRAPGYFVRKNQAAESSVLSHPMSWLDDRIFGWNRSAFVGQSIWDNSYNPSNPSSSSHGRPRSNTSNPPSTPVSPYVSDDEEEADVDYDDVLAIIDNHRNKGDHGGGGGGGEPTSPRGKYKRGRSYHDLTALKSPRSPTGGMSNVPLPKAENETTKLLMRKNIKTNGHDEK